MSSDADRFELLNEAQFTRELLRISTAADEAILTLPADEQAAISFLVKRANERLRPQTIWASVRNMLPRRPSVPPADAARVIAENAEWARRFGM